MSNYFRHNMYSYMFMSHGIVYFDVDDLDKTHHITKTVN